MTYIKLQTPHESFGDFYDYQLQCATCGKLEERYSKTGELGKQYDHVGNVVMTESDECRDCFYKHDNIQI